MVEQIAKDQSNCFQVYFRVNPIIVYCNCWTGFINGKGVIGVGRRVTNEVTRAREGEYVIRAGYGTYKRYYKSREEFLVLSYLLTNFEIQMCNNNLDLNKFIQRT